MREIALFVEDFAHKEFLAALLQRLAAEYGVAVHLDWRNARRGHGAVVNELKQFLRDLQRGRDGLPDLVVVATDANCKGLVERLRQITEVTGKVDVHTVCAVPDPHIERWLLVDSAAFKSVFGRGCDAPDQKCERARYKKMLIDAIRSSGVIPNLGGIEFADDIVAAMDLTRAAAADASLSRLIEDLRAVFKGWQP
jgi:hypothetical protein